MKRLLPGIALLILACLLGSVLYGAAPKFVEFKTVALKPTFGTKKDWKVTAYNPKEDRTGTIVAKVCFWVDPVQKESRCMPIQSAFAYQSVKDLSVVPVRQSKPAVWGVLLVADHFIPEGGSGSSTAVLIWTYDPSGDDFEQNMFADVSEIGEYRILNEGPLAGHFVTAEAFWDGDEGHFGRHHFEIKVYKYGELDNGSAAGYFPVLQYITSIIYESEEVHVIVPELDNIKRFLGVIYPESRVVK